MTELAFLVIILWAAGIVCYLWELDKEMTKEINRQKRVAKGLSEYYN